MFGKYHVKQAFAAKVIQKTDAVKKKIEERLQNSFMFGALEAKDLKVVIDAMGERNAKSGE